MSPSTQIFEVSFILLFATIFRTAFGFGEALVAVPLLALIIPVQVAAPVAVLISILVAGFVVIRDWKHIHLASAAKLIISTFFGIPLGLLLLKFGSEVLVKSLLAFVLFTFALYSLLRPRKVSLHDDRYAWLFGFLAGVCGGSYGVNGPPLAIYGSLRGWEPEKFRATLQGYFLPASFVGMCGYYFAGLWTREVNVLFVYSLPAVALGILFGRLVSRHLHPQRFTRVVNFGLIVIAFILLAQVLR